MAKKGLKITNEKSNVAAPIGSTKEAFNQAVTEASTRLAEYKTRSWDLGTKFKAIIESSVLADNKSILLKNLENETLTQLSQLASDINNDDSQPEGTGSVALCQLIMKMLVLQKDNNNKLKFRLEKIEENIIGINEQQIELQGQIDKLKSV